MTTILLGHGWGLLLGGGYFRKHKGKNILLSVLAVLGMILLSGCGSFFFSIGAGHENLSAAPRIRAPHSDPLAAYRFGRYLQSQGKHRLAVHELGKAVAADPKNVQAWNAMGVSCDLLGEYKQAAECYQAALKLSPDLASPHNNIGVSALLQDRNPEAVSSLSRAVHLAPGIVRYRNNLGLAYARSGRMQEAFGEFEKAGGTTMAHRLMAAFYRQAGQPALARKHLKLSLADAQKSDVSGFNPFADPSGVFQGAGKPARNGEDKNIYRASVDTDRVISSPLVLNCEEGPAATKDSDSRKKISDPAASAPSGPSSASSTLAERQAEDKSSPALSPGIEISNGNGVRGMAARIGAYLRTKGYVVPRLTNAENFNHSKTMIYYLPQYLQPAYQVAQEIPGWQDMREVESLDREDIKIEVLIGKDVIPYDGPQFAAL